MKFFLALSSAIATMLLFKNTFSLISTAPRLRGRFGNRSSMRMMSTTATTKNFYTVSEEELTQTMKSWGQPSFRTKQVRNWVFDKGVDKFSDMKDLPLALREQLDTAYTIGTLKLISEQVSKDGTRKRAYELHDGQLIESVLMPYEDGRQTACVSSQAGCAMGCVFCATGQMGFFRQLTSAEIFEQVQRFSAELRRSSDTQGKPQRLSNVVMMGMGEPLANYESVMTACKRMNTELGIGARHITISTVGLAPRIRKLADEDLQIGLAVSLHQATDEKRNALMPVNQRYPIEELLDACRYYIDKTHRRISFEWALIRGETDTTETARELGELLRGMLCHVNVIPLNPTKGYGGKPTSKAGVDEFCRILGEYGVPATPRTRRGIDIDAGCGQLKAELMKRKRQAAIIASTSGVHGEAIQGADDDISNNSNDDDNDSNENARAAQLDASSSSSSSLESSESEVFGDGSSSGLTITASSWSLIPPLSTDTDPATADADVNAPITSCPSGSSLFSPLETKEPLSSESAAVLTSISASSTSTSTSTTKGRGKGGGNVTTVIPVAAAVAVVESVVCGLTEDEFSLLKSSLDSEEERDTTYREIEQQQHRPPTTATAAAGGKRTSKTSASLVASVPTVVGGKEKEKQQQQQRRKSGGENDAFPSSSARPEVAAAAVPTAVPKRKSTSLLGAKARSLSTTGASSSTSTTASTTPTSRARSSSGSASGASSAASKEKDPMSTGSKSNTTKKAMK